MCLTSAVLAACSTQSSGSSGTAVSTGSANKSPILIGTEAPINTNLISYPGIFSAVEAAAATVNSEGGINGHPIKVFTCNTQDTSNGELGCARQAVANHVVAMVGANVDNATEQYSKEMTAAQIVDVANTGADLYAYSGSNAYPVTFIDGTFNPCVSGLLASSSGHPKTAVLVANANAQAQALFEPFFANQAKADGVKWLTPIIAPTTVSDYSPYVAQAQADHPGMVVMLLTGSGPQAFVHASSQAGATYDVCTALGLDGSGQWSGLGSEDNNLYVGADFSPVTNASGAPPLMKTLYASMEARYKGGDSAANPAPTTIQAQAVEAWLGTWAFAQAARTIQGSVTAASVFNAMPQLKATFGGIVPNVDFAKSQDCGLFKRVYNSTEYLWKYNESSNDYTQVGSLPNDFQTSVCGS
jgi:ABC-type branched-subunit amino acid transport system substrate-binding protein